jgi:hypothetical protein
MRSSPRSARTSLLALALLAALAAHAASCRSAGSTQREVAQLVRHGRYGEALELAAEEARRNPRDEEAQETLRRAKVALMLAQGRDAVFAGDAEAGLDIFQRAWAIDPGNPIVAQWLEKARQQLAVRWLDYAQDLSGEDLEEARHAFQRVLDYDPKNQDAQLGLSRTLLRMNYRFGLSESYYREGLLAFRLLLLQPADRGFGISKKYAPGPEEEQRAEERREEVRAMLVQERLAQARDLEREGLYFAASNEYRLALLLDSDNVEAREGRDRMDREVRAQRKLSEADMHIRRGEFEKAGPLLDEGALLSREQGDIVSRLRSQVEEARLRELYDRARTFERDYMYPEAVAAYGVLLSEVEFFDDAITRKATLEDWIEKAGELYALAQAADTPRERYDYLRQIEVIWPEYRDVEEQIAELEPQIRAEGEGPGT